MASDFDILSDTEKQNINLTVASITAKTVTALKAEQDRVGIKSFSGNLKKINVRYSKKNGLVQRIAFKIKKHGIYKEKGAGRGYGGKGSSWKDKNGDTIRTNPASLGKMNTGNRPAKEWFNPVIENYVQEITNAVAQKFVDASFKNLKIK